MQKIAKFFFKDFNSSQQIELAEFFAVLNEFRNLRNLNVDFNIDRCIKSSL